MPSEFPVMPVQKRYFATPLCNFLHGLAWALLALEQSPYVDPKASVTAMLAFQRLRRHAGDEYLRMRTAGEIPPELGEDDMEALEWLGAALGARLDPGGAI